MSILRFPVTTAFALGMALCGCDPSGDDPSSRAHDPDAAARPGDITPMDREITALKTRENDPAHLDTEYREILSRYGYAVSVPAETAPAAPPASPGPEQVTDGPLAKSAAFFTSWKTVKNFDFDFAFAYMHKMVVANNASITASADRVASPTDPVLVAYYRTSGTAASTAYTIRSVGYNDDKGDGSRNSFLSWTNTTGATVTLEIMVFAYSSSTTGKMNMSFTGPNSTTKLTLNVQAWPQLKNSNPGPFAGCSSPQATQIQLKRKTGGGFGSGLLALNRGSMRGGFIWETGASDTQTLALQDVLTNGAGSFMLGVMLDTDEFVYEDTRFAGIQQDKYTCELRPSDL